MEEACKHVCGCCVCVCVCVLGSLPIVGEPLEVNDKDLRQFPEIKLFRGLHEVFALWAVPSKAIGMRVASVLAPWRQSSQIPYSECVNYNQASSLLSLSVSVKSFMQSPSWIALLLSCSVLLQDAWSRTSCEGCDVCAGRGMCVGTDIRFGHRALIQLTASGYVLVPH